MISPAKCVVARAHSGSNVGRGRQKPWAAPGLAIEQEAAETAPPAGAPGDIEMI
jgi:hypothetical protein